MSPYYQLETFLFIFFAFFFFLSKVSLFSYQKKEGKKQILCPPYWPQFWPPTGQEETNFCLRVAIFWLILSWQTTNKRPILSSPPPPPPLPSPSLHLSSPPPAACHTRRVTSRGRKARKIPRADAEGGRAPVSPILGRYF